jgi:cytosolic prostaglandin-E synthase
MNSSIDVKDEVINLTDNELHFQGTSGDKPYAVNIAFFKNVNAAGSTYKVLPRSVQMLLQKEENDKEEFWPRLLQDKTLEKNHVTIDWDRYVDEDEDTGDGFDMSNLEGGMDMGGMGGMGGMDMEALMKQMGGLNGAGGMPEGMGDDDFGDDDENDDDDDVDDLPDLEETN